MRFHGHRPWCLLGCVFSDFLEGTFFFVRDPSYQHGSAQTSRKGAKCAGKKPSLIWLELAKPQGRPRNRRHLATIYTSGTKPHGELSQGRANTWGVQRPKRHTHLGRDVATTPTASAYSESGGRSLRGDLPPGDAAEALRALPGRRAGPGEAHRGPPPRCRSSMVGGGGGWARRRARWQRWQTLKKPPGS